MSNPAVPGVARCPRPFPPLPDVPEPDHGWPAVRHALPRMEFIAVNSTNTPEFLTTKQVAEQLQVSQRTVCNWIADGRLPSFRIGRRHRIRPVDVARMVEVFR